MFAVGDILQTFADVGPIYQLKTKKQKKNHEGEELTEFSVVQ